MSTTVWYNHVIIKDCQTLSFEQTVEYDDSRTDKLFDRFVVRVVGHVHAENIPAFGVQLDSTSSKLLTGATATDRMSAIHHALSQPRAMFSYEVGGQLLLSADPRPGYIDSDVNNGPKPIKCVINRVVGSSHYEVEFEIEISRVLCDASQSAALLALASATGAKPNDRVLNNRWRVVEEVDQHLKRRRTLEGTLRVSNIAYWPHAFRALCVPPLAKGFRRERMLFADTPDGLVLNYSVTDEEKYAAPPPPAIDWEASYTEISGVGGQMGWAEMTVKLTGPLGVDKQKLLSALWVVVDSRIKNIRHAPNPQATGNYYAYPEHIAVVEYLHEPVVQANIRVRHIADKQNAQLNLSLSQIGKPVVAAGYDPQRWPVPGVWVAESPYGMFAKYLQSPCWPVHGVPQAVAPDINAGTDTQNPGEDPDTPSLLALIYHGLDALADMFGFDASVTTDHLSSGRPYTYYAVHTEYDLQDGVMQLPVARWGGPVAPPASPASVFIPLHRGIGRYAYVCHAERINQWPEIPPAPFSTVDPNGIAMQRFRRRIIPSAPEVGADGTTRLFKLQIRFDYLLESNPQLDQAFMAGTTPTQPYSAADNRINGSDVFK